MVFFPGSTPLYVNQAALVGGLGVSGDGVDQDDVVTFAAKTGFDVPPILRADEFLFAGDIRLPFQKFNRQPNINPFGSQTLSSPPPPRP